MAMTLPTTTPHPLDAKFESLSILVVNDSPHVTILGLDRPHKRNAINAKMWRELGEAFRLLGTLGDGCRCILLIGMGKAFSAGIDMSDPSFFPTQGGEEDAARRGMAFRSQIIDMQRSFSAVEDCPVPVVAAIHGSCIGAGVDLACCADIRLCTPSSKFGIREVCLGLAADVGTLQRLPKIVGHGSRVRELCLTGEDFNGSEAARIGFVSRTSPDEHLVPMAMAVCNTIASNSPVAVAGTKMSLNYSRDHSVADGLEHIAAHNAMALMTDDLMVSFAATANGSRPSYSNLMTHSRL